VIRHPIRLADGRELIYFDDDPGVAGNDPGAAGGGPGVAGGGPGVAGGGPRPGRDAPDRRELPPPPPPSELRYDPLVDEWVAIAAHRQTRTFLPPAAQCPLCPSTAERSTEVPAADYDVAVFENRFPAFSYHLPGEVAAAGGAGLGAGGASAGGLTGADAAAGGLGGAAGDDATGPTPFTAVRPGLGRCEVVCYTADHNASFASLPPTRVRTVLDALADRTAVLSALPGVEQVFCFENRGVEIGVTLHHPHGQIYGVPFVTPRTRAMLAAARRHADRTGGRSLYADVLAAERRSGERVVASNPHWTAYVPAAARWPFEVHVAPHRQLPDLTALSDEERDAFGPVYLDVLRRFDGLFPDPATGPGGHRPMPYISAWHQAPVRVDRELGYLHLQLFSIRRAPDKLKYLAGSESAMGVFINDIRPEQAAELLRNVIPHD
jgi:UDPglucose--hexose-1-phosphate uridylyltransferase